MSFSLLPAEADAAATSAPRRRSARERQEPISLQAEQEGEYLARGEAADVEAALLLSLQGDNAAMLITRRRWMSWRIGFGMNGMPQISST